MQLKKLGIILCCVLFSISSLFGSEWKLKMNEEGIRVYSRSFPGSKFMEFRATATIKTDIETINAIFMNVRGYKKWFPDLIESRVLNKSNENEMIIYQLVDAPWPIKSRDSIFRRIISRDPATGVIIVKFIGMPDYIPDNEGIIRVRLLDSAWRFTPDSKNGSVKIAYQQHSEPGGTITAALSNPFIKKRYFKIMKNLRTLAMKEKSILVKE